MNFNYNYIYILKSPALDKLFECVITTSNLNSEDSEDDIRKKPIVECLMLRSCAASACLIW